MLHEQLTEQIIRCAFTIYNKMGWTLPAPSRHHHPRLILFIPSNFLIPA
jgi:hypothetical protein